MREANHLVHARGLGTVTLWRFVPKRFTGRALGSARLQRADRRVDRPEDVVSHFTLPCSGQSRQSISVAEASERLYGILPNERIRIVEGRDEGTESAGVTTRTAKPGACLGTYQGVRVPNEADQKASCSRVVEQAEGGGHFQPYHCRYVPGQAIRQV